MPSAPLRLLVSVLLLAAAAPVAADSAAHGTLDRRNRIVAVVNTDVITAGDVAEAMAPLYGQFQSTTSAKDLPSKVEEAERREAEVQGKVSGLAGTCPNKSFTVNGVNVLTDKTTEFSGGKCEQLAKDLKVEVKGTYQADKSVKAAKVKLEDSGKK